MEPISVARFVEENLKTIFAYALSRVSGKEDAEGPLAFYVRESEMASLKVCSCNTAAMKSATKNE